MSVNGAFSLSLDVEISLSVRTMRIQLDTSHSSIAIVGPSGAGKSTILRVLAGVERRARGTVRFAGQTWQDTASGTWVQPWLRGVGWVPQEVLLFPHLGVLENLGYAGAGELEIREIAALLQITPLLDRRPRRLSGGERQRVALGRALLAKPKILLLDEPFSALDRSLRAELSEVVRAWTEVRGVPLVLVSHDAEDARVLAEERFTMTDGELKPQ